MSEDEADGDATDADPTGDPETIPDADVTGAEGATDEVTTADGDATADGEARTPGEKIADAVAPVDRQLRRLDWYPIVTKEFADTIRSRAVIAFTVVLLALYVAPVVIALYTDLGSRITGFSQLLILGQVYVMSIVAPIAGIAFGFASISGERERGSIKFLLAQPFDRRDVLVGKLFGRFAAVTVPLFGVLLLQLLVVLPSDVIAIELRTWVIFVGLGLSLALVFVGFAVGASAATRTTRRTLVVAGGVWAYLFLLWDSVSRGVPTLWKDLFELEAAMQTKVELFIRLLNPTAAFQTLVTSFTGATQAEARASMIGGLLSGQQSLIRRQEALAAIGDPIPWYLTDPVAVASLALWLVVPLAIGYAYFREADL
jgi:ABC-2 type transport system permease protein